MESANLKLNENVDLPLPPDRMWTLVTEPASIVSCMPGASLTGVNDDGSLSGELVTKLGPTTVRFHGKVILDFDHDRRVGTLKARGGDKGGRTKAAATVSFRLTPAGAPGASQVAIDAVIDVSGGLAPFVRTGGLHLTRRMLQDFSANLGALAAGEEAQAGGGSPAGGQPEAGGRPAPAPVQASPVQASPVQASPVQASPVQTSPVQAKPVQAKPINGFGLLARALLDAVRAAFRKARHRDQNPSPADAGRTAR